MLSQDIFLVFGLGSLLMAKGLLEVHDLGVPMKDGCFVILQDSTL